MLVDAACHAYSMISVPLYDTLGPDAVRFICSHAQLSAMACCPTALSNVLEVLPQSPSIKLVVRTSPIYAPVLRGGHAYE